MTVTHERSPARRASPARAPRRRRRSTTLRSTVHCVRDGHVATAATTRHRRRRAARRRPARRRGRRGAAAARPARALPRPARPLRSRPAPTTAGTPRPRGWTRRWRAGRWRPLRGGRARHGLEAFGIWTAGEVRTAPRVDARGSRALRRGDRRLREGHRRDAGGRSGFAAGHGSPPRTSRRRRGGRGGGGKVAPGRAARLAPGEYAVRALHRRRRDAARVPRLAGLQRPRARRGPRRAVGRLGTRVAAPRSTSPTRPRFAAHAAARLRRRGRRRSGLSPLIQDGVAHRVVHDTALGRGSPAAARAPPATRWRPAARRGARAHQPGPGRRRRARRQRARGADRARPLRDPALVRRTRSTPSARCSRA